MPKVETELLVLSLKAQASEPHASKPEILSQSLRARAPGPSPSQLQPRRALWEKHSFFLILKLFEEKKNLRKNFFWTWKNWTEDVFLSVSFSSERNGNVATRSVSAEKCFSKVFLIRLLETSSHRYQRSCEGRLFSQAVLIKHCSFFLQCCTALFFPLNHRHGF